MEKIKTQGYIDFDDVKDIKFRTNLLQSQKMLSLLKKVSLTIDCKFEDLLAVFGLKEQETKKDLNLPKIIGSIFDIFFLNAYVENENKELTPNMFLDELVTILSSITKIDKNIILESHQEVVLEMVLRSYVGYRTDSNKGFFSSIAITKILPQFMNFIPLLNGMNRESLNIQNELSME